MMNIRDDDHVSGREFQNFRDDVTRQFNEIKNMTAEQTREFRKLIDELRHEIQPLAADYDSRRQQSSEQKEDRRAVRNSVIDWILKVSAGGALGIFLAWIGFGHN